ncbi:tRNA isopentenyltransferase [Lophiostoma macrostomum CBS 122681]|uniref:tRNA dimethylallyltransferase n=1 Tax=Lophiostoma macrostomum CBS 122681 TaxID=1314788 RepID=A0A6A6T1L1_9PLEO|nr:tRNA isopentenyltransferase [Lophiostoma macrostomum CBS 122681]
MKQPPLRPLVAIVGATGTGKSDLAVDIARKFNGEIINGDAMQLYRGLPVITNKITEAEMQGVPHHLLGCIGLDEETWTVGKFVGNALRVISEIRSRGRLPILVGGTHYYTQSLLFKGSLSDESLPDGEEVTMEDFAILSEPTDVILEKLREVDPVMADRWHPNERRKIQRSLELYLRTGKPASEIYNEQRKRPDTPLDQASPDIDSDLTTGTAFRFPTLVLWVHAPKDVLYPRLEARIHRMIDRGLLDEVRSLANFRISHDTSNGTPVDQSRGIWVSIGYKEFLDYQSAMSGKLEDASGLDKIKTMAIERTQAATRQYANRQLRWIRIKLLNAIWSAKQQENLFLLDGSDISRWDDLVVHPAWKITARFVSGDSLPKPTELSALARELLTPKRDYDLGRRPDLWQRRVCETCGTVAVTENDWELHRKSRGHRRAVGLKKKQENASHIRSRDLITAQTELLDVLEASLHTFAEEDCPEH